MSRVLASVVSYRSGPELQIALDSLLAQDCDILVTDNSGDATFNSHPRIELIKSAKNTGFAEPNNYAAARAIKSDYDFLLLLNPDCVLTPGALEIMVKALDADASAGVCCPKLLRADDELRSLIPPTIDCAGIYFSTSLRHFDRGGGEIDHGQYERSEYVIGASGACALISARLLRDLDGKLFDDLFFAYREDADLAWRMSALGWKTRYEPTAIGFHRRQVTHRNRRDQSPEVNAYGVRNRFILLGNNWRPWAMPKTILPTLLRNVVIKTGVYLQEKTSIPALRTAKALAPVTKRERQKREAASRCRPSDLARWFNDIPYSESAVSIHTHSESSDFRPIVHAVVINYISGGRLKDCVDALKKIRPTNYSLKFSVVDNSPTPEFSGPDFDYHHFPENLGFAGAINRIMHRTDADFLLTLNPDTILTEGALSELVRACVVNNDITAIAPVFVDTNGVPQFGFTVKRLPTISSSCVELLGLRGKKFRSERALRYEDDPLLRNYLLSTRPEENERTHTPFYTLGVPIAVEQPPAACLLIKTSELKKIGGFDERFYPAWFEDVDVCRQLRDQGKLVCILNSARVVHEGGYTVKNIGRKRVSTLYFRNMSRYWSKNGSVFGSIPIRILSGLRLLF